MDNDLFAAVNAETQVTETATPAAGEAQQSGDGQEQEQQQPGTTGSEAGTEQTSQAGNAGSEQQQQQTDQTKADKKRTPWYQHRINELTRERKETEEKLRREAAENERLKKTLEAMQRGEEEDQGDGKAKPAATTTAENVDVDKLVADRVAAEQRTKAFNDACNNVYQAGKNEFADFDQALGQFGLLGAIPPHFLEAATAIEGGHKVLYHLAHDLDQAKELLALPPVQLAIKLADIRASLGRPSKPVSRAPAPIKPIDGGGKGEIDLSKASLEQFMEKRNREAPVKR